MSIDFNPIQQPTVAPTPAPTAAPMPPQNDTIPSLPMIRGRIDASRSALRKAQEEAMNRRMMDLEQRIDEDNNAELQRALEEEQELRDAQDKDKQRQEIIGYFQNNPGI